tara:strand:+ start:909 stop:1736 length:828 start_codon:yes stop_codon:yes gene_type:complete
MNSTNNQTQTIPHRTDGEEMLALMKSLCLKKPNLVHPGMAWPSPDDFEMINSDDINHLYDEVAYYIYDNQFGWDESVSFEWNDTWRSVEWLDITHRQQVMMLDFFDIILPPSWITLNEPFSYDDDEEYDDEDETEDENCSHLLTGVVDNRSFYQMFTRSIEYEIVDRINSIRPTRTDKEVLEECTRVIQNTIVEENNRCFYEHTTEQFLEIAETLINIDSYETLTHTFEKYIQYLQDIKKTYTVDKNNEFYLHYLFVINNINPLIEYLTTLKNIY